MNTFSMGTIAKREVSAYSNHMAVNSDRTAELAWLLNRIGIPRNTVGYEYLFLITLRIVGMNSSRMRLMTELYPKIAAETGSSVSRIERAVRYAIEAAWNRNRECIQGILGYPISTKPYSSEFIWLLADEFRRMDMSCGRT